MARPVFPVWQRKRSGVLDSAISPLRIRDILPFPHSRIEGRQNPDPFIRVYVAFPIPFRANSVSYFLIRLKPFQWRTDCPNSMEKLGSREPAAQKISGGEGKL